MRSKSHSYYCTMCRQYMFADTLPLLALNVNDHANKFHPLDYAAWTGETIVKAHHYTGPVPVLAIVPKPGEMHWGDAKPPVVTKADRDMLAKARIRWD